MKKTPNYSHYLELCQKACHGNSIADWFTLHEAFTCSKTDEKTNSTFISTSIRRTRIKKSLTGSNAQSSGSCPSHFTHSKNIQMIFIQFLSYLCSLSCLTFQVATRVTFLGERRFDCRLPRFMSSRFRRSVGCSVVLVSVAHFCFIRCSPCQTLCLSPHGLGTGFGGIHTLPHP